MVLTRVGNVVKQARSVCGVDVVSQCFEYVKANNLA